MKTDFYAHSQFAEIVSYTPSLLSSSVVKPISITRKFFENNISHLKLGSIFLASQPSIWITCNISSVKYAKICHAGDSATKTKVKATFSRHRQINHNNYNKLVNIGKGDGKSSHNLFEETLLPFAP